MIEIARDVDQPFKPTRVLGELAKCAEVPAYLILYKIAGENAIGDCRVARIYPDKTGLKLLTEKQVAALIKKIHVCDKCQPAKCL